MDRLVSSDAAWQRMSPLMMARREASRTDVPRRCAEDRAHGPPWQDIPEAFRHSNIVFPRKMQHQGCSMAILRDLRDFEYLIVVSAIIEATSMLARVRQNSRRPGRVFVDLAVVRRRPAQSTCG